MKYKSKNDFLNTVVDKYKDQQEFHQAVEEVIGSIWSTATKNKEYMQANILDRIIVPDRSIIFRVPWVDDNNNVQVNLGYRIQFNSSIAVSYTHLRAHET